MRISIFLLCFQSILCTAQPACTFKKYVNDNNDIIAIQYPSDWIAANHANAELVFVRPQISAVDTIFRENFNVSVSSSMNYKSVETFAEMFQDKIKGHIENFKKEKSEVVVVGNMKCVKMVYTYTEGIFMVKAVLYQYLIADHVYNITCTATKNTFEKYAATFDKIGKSFDIQ